MNELKTKHQLLKGERTVKRIALENDDFDSKSTSAGYKSPFHWTPKKRDISYRARRKDNPLTPKRSAACFKSNLKRTGRVNSHYFAFYATVHQALKTKKLTPHLITIQQWFSGSNTLQKLKFYIFEGNPLERP